MYAATAIGELGPRGRIAVPNLVRALNCGNDLVEREAAIAIGKVAIGMPEAVEPLRRKIEYPKNDAAILLLSRLAILESLL